MLMNKGHADIPSNWVEVTWQDRLERIPSDYGEPQPTYGVPVKRMTKEEEESYFDELDKMNPEDIIW